MVESLQVVAVDKVVVAAPNLAFDLHRVRTQVVVGGGGGSYGPVHGGGVCGGSYGPVHGGGGGGGSDMTSAR